MGLGRATGLWLAVLLALAPAIALAAAQTPAVPKDSVEGTAQLLCRAAAEGGLSDCVIASETPANKGIGAKALQMATKLRIPVTGPDSRPVGAQVRVPVHVVRPIKVERGSALKSPTAAQMAEVYPPDAARDKIKARVELACLVTTTGAPHDCWPASETPAGRGFGEAAMKLVPLIQFRPMMYGSGMPPGSVVAVESEQSLVLQFTPPR